LNDCGCYIEYETSLENIDTEKTQATWVQIKQPNGKTQESVFEWVIGADGFHGMIREEVGFNFVGKIYPEEWSVSEIETDEWDTNIQAKLFLGSDGTGLFLSNPEPGVVQGMLNGPNVGSYLLKKFPNAKKNYERQLVLLGYIRG
jgi:2-polyprenyl-6-methoxyphenol hydroxylase-like FAD-dependent oxidoreductase